MIDTNEIYKHYIRDLIFLLKEEVHKQVQESDSFAMGMNFGIRTILDLIESQAQAFELDFEEIGFYDFEKFYNTENDNRT